MTNNRTAPPADRITARTATGRRTTASMPESEKARFTAGLGGPGKFRDEFNRAMREVETRPGLSRSMAVRLRLDERMKEVQAKAQD
jgi:hypothetical protein